MYQVQAAEAVAQKLQVVPQLEVPGCLVLLLVGVFEECREGLGEGLYGQEVRLVQSGRDARLARRHQGAEVTDDSGELVLEAGIHVRQIASRKQPRPSGEPSHQLQAQLRRELFGCPRLLQQPAEPVGDLAPSMGG